MIAAQPSQRARFILDGNSSSGGGIADADCSRRILIGRQDRSARQQEIEDGRAEIETLQRALLEKAVDQLFDVALRELGWSCARQYVRGLERCGDRLVLEILHHDVVQVG